MDDTTTQAKHTPGPLGARELSKGRLSLYCGGRFVCGIETSDLAHVASEDRANADLICSAYTSYDKHCGVRAIECAEADLLGEALEACKELVEGWDRAGQSEKLDVAIRSARAVLAKADAKGGG